MEWDQRLKSEIRIYEETCTLWPCDPLEQDVDRESENNRRVTDCWSTGKDLVLNVCLLGKHVHTSNIISLGTERYDWPAGRL